MRVLIAVPTYENITPDTFKSIYDLDRCGNELAFDFVRGYDCAAARNNIAQLALNMNADYILSVDNDMKIPRDCLKNMLEDNVDVCLGYYAHRNAENRYDGRVNICKDDGEFNYTHMYTGTELRILREKGCYKIAVHGGGMGCALIRTDVFRRLQYPWYAWVNYPDRGVLSEDLYFCEQCRINGIKIYTDTRVLCGHLFRTFIWPE